MLATTALREGLTLFFINVIFERMQELQGWSFSEVLLMYGLLTTSRFLSTLVLDIPYPLVGYVRSGRLDILLIRPAAPLIQIIGETGFNTSGIGSIPVGIAIILYALSRPDVQPHLWWAFYIPLVVFTSTLLFTSLVGIVACLAFRFTSVNSAMFPIGWLATYGHTHSQSTRRRSNSR